MLTSVFYTDEQKKGVCFETLKLWKKGDKQAEKAQEVWKIDRKCLLPVTEWKIPLLRMLGIFRSNFSQISVKLP